MKMSEQTPNDSSEMFEDSTVDARNCLAMMRKDTGLPKDVRNLAMDAWVAIWKLKIILDPVLEH